MIPHGKPKSPARSPHGLVRHPLALVESASASKETIADRKVSPAIVCGKETILPDSTSPAPWSMILVRHQRDIKPNEIPNKRSNPARGRGFLRPRRDFRRLRLDGARSFKGGWRVL